jgi:hypothetical protein
MNDVMNRLRAANPVLEDSALPPVEPLLARLDPAPPPRRRRTRALTLAFAATVALVAVVLVSELRSVDVVAEAREALGETRAIIHLRVHEERLNPDGSPVQASGTRPEIWSARDPLRIRTRQRSRTGSVIESSYAGGVTKAVDTRTGKVQTTRLDPEARKAFEDGDGQANLMQPGFDPIPAIRRLLAEGKLQHEGSTTVDGREVERLVGSEPSPDAMIPRVDVEYLVDASSYAPVRLSTRATLRDGRPAGASRITFELYEELPRTPANEALLNISR